MRKAVPRLLALVLLAGAARAEEEAPGPPAFVPLDFATVDRSIAEEPTYLAAPRYALFVFDAAGAYRVWAVLDKSAADGACYDVLYFDRNGNRDLTEEGERHVTTYREGMAAAGLAVTFALGDVEVPGGLETHTKLRIATEPKKGRRGVWFSMMWRGQVEISGGYGPLGFDTTRWGTSPANAPILRPTPEGTLTFATWGATEHRLVPGEPYHVNVLVGQAGAGEDALCVVDEDYLDLARDRLFVTVIARDEGGHEVRERTPITGHC